MIRTKRALIKRAFQRITGKRARVIQELKIHKNGHERMVIRAPMEKQVKRLAEIEKGMTARQAIINDLSLIHI